MGTAKDKLKALWQDRRPGKIRLPLAALSAFTFVFTFILFGPCEIYITNIQEMTFPFRAMVLTLLLFGAFLFVLLFGLLILLRGKIFNYAMSILFAVTFAGYLQGNFLSLNSGSLDGNAVDWLNYKPSMLTGLLLWLLILVAVFMLLYLSRKAWSQCIRLVSVILIATQLIALVVILVDADAGRVWRAGQDQYVSRDSIYEIAPKNNVIVFLLDRMDNRYMDEELKLHPDWADRLGDFTYYHNFTGSYANTRPAITYLFTGVQHDYSVPWEKYFKKAWEEPVYTLLPDIHNAGYQTHIYTEGPYVFDRAQNVEEFVDNIDSSRRKVNYPELLKRVMDLSVYRYAPEIFRPFFHIYTGDLGNIVSVEGGETENDIYMLDDVTFWREYKEQGLRINQDSQGLFLFYHLNGAHTPFCMDENAQELSADEGATLDSQVTGNMNMIFQYMDRLKELGLYDDTTIIITTDHGRPPRATGDFSAVSDSRVCTLLIKPAGVHGEGPMKVSHKQVCQDDLRASIASYFGLDTSAYGPTIESIGEDEERIRYVWMRGERGDVYNILFTFKITGDANDFSNWELIGETEMKYPGL